MQVNIALLTITDTRTIENDKSGGILVKKNLSLKIKNLKNFILITSKNKGIILTIEKNLNLRKNLRIEKDRKNSPLKNLKKTKLLQLPCNHR